MKYLLYLLGSFLLVATVSGQNLTARLAKAILQIPVQPASVIYDNDDSIYIFAGYNSDLWQHFPDIYKYHISLDLIERVGWLPVAVGRGSASIDSQGNLYHIGGADNVNIFRHEIYKLDPRNNSIHTVALLPPEGNEMGKVFQIPGETDIVYIVMHNGDFQGDPGVNIIKFNMSDLTTQVVGRLDLHPEYHPVGVIPHPNNTDEILIFGCTRFFTPPCETIVSYSLTTNLTVPMPLPSMPRMDVFASDLIWTGNIAYFNSPNLGGGFTGTRFLRYDPNSNPRIVEEIHVNDYPGNDGIFFNGAGFTYIPKLNRIYIIGGLSMLPDFTQKVESRIWYIDLE